MIHLITLGIIFIVLFISFIWIFLYLGGAKEYPMYQLKQHEKITIAIPAYNEEDGVIESLRSLRQLDYSKKYMDIIVIDDGSTDQTGKNVKTFIRKNTDMQVRYIHQSNSGKAAAVNHAIKKAEGKYFSVLDADSTVSPDSLKNIIALFQHSEPTVGAIISSMKISNTHKFLPRVQRIEYLVTIFLRQLMSDADLLHTTHGVLCVTRLETVKDLGGFDTENITEDFEIAVRLRSQGYRVISCKNSLVYTNAPETLRTFWQQRIRWYRGFIETHRKYKHMIANTRFGMLGWFQLPLNIITPIILLVAFAVMVYNISSSLYHFLFRLVFVDGYLWALFSTVPSIREFLLTLRIHITLPIFITTLVGLLMIFLAVRFIDDRFRNPIPILIYLFLFPPLTMLQWVWAIYLEIRKANKKW